MLQTHVSQQEPLWSVVCGLEQDAKEIGIQRTLIKIHGLLPQLL